ncbi:sodium:solute symporter family protein [Falsirhodobacter algicola]|uniref:Sodium:solute symporter family protein n=1 Tax=Falsirhodobacter algicola TaxID=2692330 RepID=A0A8J8MT71_9RHOB|nr:sodium:solute symporter family protein [Falsirhodobacter algicola]QUS36242.1 sodium:solute symporter family protein [Falsirhodobacter algicola]
MTETLIWTGVAIYLLISGGVAFLARSGATGGMAGYFIGDRRVGGIISALSYSATTYSAFMMVGLAGLAYRGGVGALGFEIVYFAGVSLVAVFGPRFWAVGRRYGFVTPSEMLGHRYASPAVAATAAIASCLFLIPYSAVQLSGIGYLMSGMTGGGISFGTGVVLATAIALLFSYVAGIRSVLWTDSLQALLMIIACSLVAIVVVEGLGGFGTLFGTIAAQRPEMLTVPGPGLFSFVTFLGLTIPWFFFALSNPQASQRLFMPASLGAMRRMLLIFLCFGLIYTVVSVLWGFSALVAFPGLERPDLATATLLASDHVPPVLGMIVMIGILAAAISTIDSILLTLSSMLARDVYAPLSGAGDQRQLWLGKLVIPVIAVLSLIFAALELDLIALLSVAASAGLIVVVPSIVGAFFWRRGTAAGSIASMAGGGAFVIAMYATGNSLMGLPAGILGLPVAAALFVGVSLATRPPQIAADFIATADAALAPRPKRGAV